MAHTGCTNNCHGMQFDSNSNDAMVSRPTVMVVHHRSANYARFWLVQKSTLSITISLYQNFHFSNVLQCHEIHSTARQSGRSYGRIQYSQFSEWISCQKGDMARFVHYQRGSSIDYLLDCDIFTETNRHCYCIGERGKQVRSVNVVGITSTPKQMFPFRAVSSTLTTIFFPIFPWVFQILFIVFAVTVGLYLASVGNQVHTTVGLDNTCVCSGPAAQYTVW